MCIAMFTMKAWRLTMPLVFAAAALAVAVPTAQASVTPAVRVPAAFLFSPGEKLVVLYNNSPLRTCPSTSCGVIAYMPATTSLNPGGGWVTSLSYQSSSNPWCVINWRGDGGYTGCWRLGIPA
jgi:hypothetical protein